MELSELLKPEAIRASTTSSSKKRLMHDVAELAQAAYGIDAGTAVEALLERESLGPTGVGHGVALPHARISGIEGCCGVFMLMDKPIDFDSVDRQPVDIVFGLFAPEDAGVEHLKALARVSRLLRDPAVCTKLRANHDAGTLFTILTEDEAMKAA
ncbi:PTS sugar transporter subunit IIA [Marinovum sp. 2_MG-2023]|uniref:PTS sugar transporter subunit IIA n=1 Tax=Roseobacteraceae TaxID=2854170 RepID=UPI001FD2C89E|nr:MULTISPECIES: PTS sugar transporter subunit IIA [Roseobacteraceae]MCJ7871234.1 PTS sugar transporter subunit IIA [Phaeobacter sp. J2-8]MDO6732344.1 PTS sugar transporter subunit IIA [Marinovum sp. 2_MG-2023]MDO6781661.1 PTS sugar transporter subunit IIA [Marinovum sp. 1_MG-2023]